MYIVQYRVQYSILYIDAPYITTAVCTCKLLSVRVSFKLTVAVSSEAPAIVAGRAEAGIVAAVRATGTAGSLVTAVATWVGLQCSYYIDYWYKP